MVESAKEQKETSKDVKREEEEEKETKRNEQKAIRHRFLLRLSCNSLIVPLTSCSLRHLSW